MCLTRCLPWHLANLKKALPRNAAWWRMIWSSPSRTSNKWPSNKRKKRRRNSNKCITIWKMRQATSRRSKKLISQQRYKKVTSLTSAWKQLRISITRRSSNAIALALFSRRPKLDLGMRIVTITKRSEERRTQSNWWISSSWRTSLSRAAEILQSSSTHMGTRWLWICGRMTAFQATISWTRLVEFLQKMATTTNCLRIRSSRMRGSLLITIKCSWTYPSPICKR